MAWNVQSGTYINNNYIPLSNFVNNSNTISQSCPHFLDIRQIVFQNLGTLYYGIQFLSMRYR
jgi:hypothetical protein